MSKLSRIVRSRSFVTVLAIILIFVSILWFWASRPPAQLTVSTSVISYDTRGRGSISARIGITNTSGTPMRLYIVSFGQDAVVRVESPKGWTTRDIGPMAKLPLLRKSIVAILPPGAGTTTVIQLPPETGRWQITYPVQPASKREAMIAKIPAKWRNSLRPLYTRLFSNKEGPEQEVTSAVFELPYVVKASHPEAPPSLLDFDPFFPAADVPKRDN